MPVLRGDELLEGLLLLRRLAAHLATPRLRLKLCHRINSKSKLHKLHKLLRLKLNKRLRLRNSRKE